MIAFPAGVRVWIAGGVTDMRRGMNTLALTVQQAFGWERAPVLAGVPSWSTCSRPRGARRP